MLVLGTWAAHTLGTGEHWNLDRARAQGQGLGGGEVPPPRDPAAESGGDLAQPEMPRAIRLGTVLTSIRSVVSYPYPMRFPAMTTVDELDGGWYQTLSFRLSSLESRRVGRDLRVLTRQNPNVTLLVLPR